MSIELIGHLSILMRTVVVKMHPWPKIIKFQVKPLLQAWH